MKEQLQKTDMVVGKEYKGYAWRNEYGEFFFRPAAVGSRSGRIKRIVEDMDYGVATTKEHVLIRIKMEKTQGGPARYIANLGSIVNKLIKVFMKYEI